MSKVDAQRAMREAKYARDSASGPTRREAAAAQGGSTTAAPAKPDAAPARAAKATPTKATPTKAAAPAKSAPAAAGGLCGHKSMNGRACTREAGHAEKNHRYS